MLCFVDFTFYDTDDFSFFLLCFRNELFSFSNHLVGRFAIFERCRVDLHVEACA